MKLTLGTVQFGLKYGISNKAGQVSPLEVRSILKLARKNNIDTLDTAYCYGDSENVIGETLKELPNIKFKIITKLSAIKEGIVTKNAIEKLDIQFNESLQRLRQNAIYAVLLHSGTDLLLSGGEYLENYLHTLKKSGQVKKIGVSVYSPEDLEKILNVSSVDIVQFPMSLLDQRFLQKGLLNSLHVQNIEVHVRSIFLQGFLFMNKVALSQKFPEQISYINTLFMKFENTKLTPFDLALGFIKKYADGISKIVVGVTSENELSSIISHYRELPCDKIDYQQFICNENAIIDPRKWMC